MENTRLNNFEELIENGQIHTIEYIDKNLSEKCKKDIIFTISYTKWTPTISNGKTLIYNHGLQSHKEWFYETATQLVKDKFTVYAFDRIGSGSSSPGISLNPCNPEKYFSGMGHIHSWQAFLETENLLVALAKNENPDSEIFLLGNSYGAKIVTAFLLSEFNTGSIRGAIFLNPGLFQNKKTMPLPFNVLRLLFSRDTRYLPTPVTSKNHDNGAHWFTSIPYLTNLIKHDKKSLRRVTRRFYLETSAMDKFIRNEIKRKNQLLLKIPRFYLLVKNDQMMDNVKTLQHVLSQSENAHYRFYKGGHDSKHYLLFTEDRDQVLEDIKSFILNPFRDWL